LYTCSHLSEIVCRRTWRPVLNDNDRRRYGENISPVALADPLVAQTGRD
jgi:hypothetical protein